MAAGAAALTAYNSKDDLSALANGKPADANVSISITVGSSQSRSDSVQNSTSSHGSNLQAGGNVNLIATGAGKDSNILVQGSDITAGKDVTLIADNQVNLLASQDTSRDRSTNSSSSAAVGLAVTVGQGGASFGITASASKGKGHANSDDVVYSNSHVNAGNTVTIQSGGDTTLKGAVVSGKQVVADIGGNLNLESLQDTSTFSGKQQNIGGSVTVGAGFSGSVSYSKSKAKGDFASVNEQTGIQAGDGGFQVNVKGNTDLKGAVIASNQTAIDNNRNSLTTGTLTHSDIENHSDYKASGVNLSGGISVAGSKPAGKQGSSGDSTVNNGTDWSWQNIGKTGVNGAAAGVSSDKGSASSTTQSGISAGAVTVTDEAAQQQKTGQSASEAATSIQSNVLTGDGSNGLQKNWDGQKLLQEQAANAQIMATFGQQASTTIGNFASNKVSSLLEQASRSSNEAEKQELLDEASKWEEGGAYRVAMHSVVGALSGGVSGAAGALASASAANLMDKLQAGIAQTLVGSGMDEQAADMVSKLVSGVTAMGVGSAVGGAQGAAAAGNADFNNRQLHPNERVLARKLAAQSNGKYTVEQIEDALRAAGNNETGESIIAGMLVSPSDKKAIYDSGAVWCVSGCNGMLVQAIPSQPEADLAQFIQNNTTGQYEWYTPSPNNNAVIAAPRDPRTGLPLDEQGRYSQSFILDGKLYQPKYFPCATPECQGSNLDKSDPGSKAFLEASNAQFFKDIGTGATYAALIAPSGIVGTTAVGASLFASLGSVLNGTDFWDELMKVGSQQAAEKLFVDALGHTPSNASRAVALIDLAGGWTAFVERFKIDLLNISKKNEEDK